MAGRNSCFELDAKQALDSCSGCHFVRHLSLCRTQNDGGKQYYLVRTPATKEVFQEYLTTL